MLKPCLRILHESKKHTGKAIKKVDSSDFLLKPSPEQMR